MPLFVCDRCHGIENTSLGLYSRPNRRLAWFGGLVAQGEVLCAKCAPAKFADGNDTKWGKWHDVFKYEVVTDEWIESYKAETGYVLSPSEGLSNFQAGIKPSIVY